MIRTVATLAILICGGALLAAQGAGTQPRPGVPVDKPAIDPSPEIVAIGCLVKEGDNYELRNSAVLIKPWLAPGLKPDAVGTPAPSPSKTVFRLMHKEGLDAHVGHKVEIVGVIQPQTANVPPSPDTIVRPGTGPGTATAPAVAVSNPGSSRASITRNWTTNRSRWCRRPVRSPSFTLLPSQTS
jgi:hypothetical protein